MGFFNWLTKNQPDSGYLLGGLSVAQRWLETKWSLSYLFNKEIKARIKQEHGKAPKWASELYVVSAIAIAVSAYYLATPIAGLQWLGLLIVVWPSYRISDMLVFFVGWIFVHEDKIASFRRSLLTFFLNMIELSLLFGTLEISIGNGLPQAGKLNHFFLYLVSIATITSPTVVTSNQGIIEIVRFIVSLLLVLIMVSTLVGGLLRPPIDPGSGK